jgi:hypothetical protein
MSNEFTTSTVFSPSAGGYDRKGINRVTIPRFIQSTILLIRVSEPATAGGSGEFHAD